MKITKEDNCFVVQEFSTLQQGDVFKFTFDFDDAVYMVINSCGIEFNAVDLATGDLVVAEENDDVYKIEYTFTIKE